MSLADVQPRPVPSRWRQLLRRALEATLPRHWFLVRIPADSGAVCLTFDDGPHPEHTPRLLDVLRRHGIPATFFVIGQAAERHPDLVRRMAAEGHTVGNHTFSHAKPDQTSARQLLDEIRRTRELLARLLGEAPTLFRPPCGTVTAAKLWRLWRAGQTVVLWNVEPRDHSCRSSDEIRAWFRGRPLRGGDVVLMHDDWPRAAEVVPDLVEAVRARGLRFAKVLEWTR